MSKRRLLVNNVTNYFLTTFVFSSTYRFQITEIQKLQEIYLLHQIVNGIVKGFSTSLVKKYMKKRSGVNWPLILGPIQNLCVGKPVANLLIKKTFHSLHSLRYIYILASAKFISFYNPVAFIHFQACIRIPF